MDNYKTIETKLKNYQPFTGNSLTAILEGDEYSVYSYSTKIARCSLGVMWHEVSPVKYSQTTTRQQNLIKRAWGLV